MARFSLKYPAMTAEALPMDWEDAADLPDGDPDATWIDPLMGRRGEKLPEAPTAFLPAALTQCLSGPEVPELSKAANNSSPGIDALPPPAEHTCLGPLVPAPAPALPSLDEEEPATVAAFDEPVIERLSPAIAEPAARSSGASLPALPAAALVSSVAVPVIRPCSASLPALAEGAEQSLVGSPWSSRESGPPAGTPALELAPARPARASAAPTRRPSTGTSGRADTAPRAARGLPAADLQAALRSPAAPSIPAVPTWAAQKTQMEGPGVWIETDADVRPRGRTVVHPQLNVPTTVRPMPAQPSVITEAPRKSRLMNEVVPFTLVLVAISLATAALVGAYL